MLQRTIFLMLLAVGPLMVYTGAAERLDLKLLDSQFKLLRAWSPQTVAKDVVVVGIDEDTAKRFPEPLTLWHAHLGRFFTAMALAKPAALGVDIILPDRSYESVLPGSDKKLLKGLLDARLSFPVVLGQTVDPSGNTRAIFPLFLKIAGASGYALFPVDRDGVVRRFDERLADGGSAVPTLAGEMARKLGVNVQAGTIDYWRGAPFSYVPLHQVLQWAESGDKDALARAFRDKPVLVGMAFPFEDRLSVAVQLAGWEPNAPNTPGVLLHAQALRNLLNDGLVQPMSALLVAAFCAVLAALWFVSARTRLVVPMIAAIVLLLGGASTWLLTKGWFFPAVAPAVTVALALGGGTATTCC